MKPEDVMKENDFLVRGISKEQLAEERGQALREGYHAILRKNDALIAKLEAYIDTLNDDKANLVEQINEKDAEIERLKKEHADYVEDVTATLSEKNAQCERLMRRNTVLECLIEKARNRGRAEAITEFENKLYEVVDDTYIERYIAEIAEKLKGEPDGKSDL